MGRLRVTEIGPNKLPPRAATMRIAPKSIMSVFSCSNCILLVQSSMAVELILFSDPVRLEMETPVQYYGGCTFADAPFPMSYGNKSQCFLSKGGSKQAHGSSLEKNKKFSPGPLTPFPLI